ncbi:hypothetical protein LEP1GSC192_0542 [Leptospira sp. B5-022]|nr:hypothetical protein LEP1GSC192_0542 [Leptospira sp. B5-022]
MVLSFLTPGSYNLKASIPWGMFFPRIYRNKAILDHSEEIIRTSSLNTSYMKKIKSQMFIIL